ncbi:MAG TPA: thioredoxin family protein [Steroidobacteraceae bacterium]|nr:thioredoxin family protein [Steroidobacteraceae bacterium]
MPMHTVVSKEEWLAARRKHLEQEKEFTRMRDRLSEARRALPWVKVEKEYVFDTPSGAQTLSGLFGGRSQLIVYHFMFGPEWAEGCPSCSFWADNFNGIDVHLRHRDIELVAISRARLARLEAYRKRMGWQFKWVSSYGNDFNQDYQVSFTPEEMEQGEVFYNFERRRFPSEEAPGISVFSKNERGEVFHTYSCYARGLDMLNGAYHYMDLAPKGRDETGLPYTMAWLRRHDQYLD